MSKYLKNVITADQTEPTNIAASGMWTLDDVETFNDPATWPSLYNYPFPRSFFNFVEMHALDNRLTFSNATGSNIRSTINSSGYIEFVNTNIFRPYYHPYTLERLGCLFEPGSVNQISYSEAFSSWNSGDRTNITIATDETNSPDGTQNADGVYETTANGEHLLSYSYSAVTSTITFGQSIYVKPSLGRDNVYLRVNSGTSSYYAIFDLTNGTITTSTSGSAAISYAYIEPYQTGWYRIALCGSCPSSINPRRIDFGIYNGGFSYVGDATKGVYFWGAQLEETSGSAELEVSSYIRNTFSSAITRQPDVITFASAQNNVTLLLNMRFMANDACPLSVTNRPRGLLGNYLGGNGFGCMFPNSSSTGARLNVWYGTASVADVYSPQSGGLEKLQQYKEYGVAVRIEQNNYAISANVEGISAIGTGLMPTGTDLSLISTTVPVTASLGPVLLTTFGVWSALYPPDRMLPKLPLVSPIYRTKAAINYDFRGITTASSSLAIVDGRLTFTRSSSVFYFSQAFISLSASASNYVPIWRENFSPSKKYPTLRYVEGLLLEGSATALPTPELSSAVWTKVNTTYSSGNVYVVSNSATATARPGTIFETTANGEHYVYKNYASITSGQPYSCSVYVMQSFAGRKNVRLLFGDGTHNFYADFNTETLTVISSGSTGDGALQGTYIEYIGLGLVRVAIYGVAGTLSTANFYIYVLDDSGQSSYTGSTNKGLVVFYPTMASVPDLCSAIPTATVNVTLGASFFSSSSTANAQNMLNGSEGTIVLAYNLPALNQLASSYSRVLMHISNSSNTVNVMRLSYQNDLSHNLTVLDSGGSVQEDIDAPGVVYGPGTVNLVAFSYKNNSFKLCTNGGTVYTSTSGSVPTFNYFRVGADYAGGNGGHICLKVLRVFTYQMSDEELRGACNPGAFS